MDTGLFSESKLYRLLGKDETEGVSYAMQFICESMATMHRYEVHHAARLRAKTQQRYGVKVLSFRTLMEIVDLEN